MTDENKNKVEIDKLKKFIATAEENLESAKKALAEMTGEEISTYQSAKPSKKLKELKVSDGGKVIEGIFNGENMVGPEGKVYPVPANYASKSKMIEGDKLKLTVSEDGSFIFKQIAPADRKNIVGTLVFEDNMYQVQAEGRKYNILFASVTYFKAKPGDRVTIIVPKNGDSDWAALENIIHDVPAGSVNEVANTPTSEKPAEEIDTSIFDIDKKPLEPDFLASAPEQTNPAQEAPVTPEPAIKTEAEPPVADIFEIPETPSPDALATPQTTPIQLEEVPSVPVQGQDAVSPVEPTASPAPTPSIIPENTPASEGSFVPPTPDENVNNLGERTPGSEPQIPEVPATELEI